MPPDYESRLNELCLIIDTICGDLQNLKAKNKRSRQDHNDQRRLSRFLENLKNVAGDWNQTIRETFELAPDGFQLNIVADYALEHLNYARSKLDIDDETYKIVWTKLVRPIIELTLGDAEVSKEATERQLRRKHMIKRFMNIKAVPKVQAGAMLSGDESIESDVDICAPGSPTRPSQADVSHGVNSSRSTRQATEVVTVLNYTIEADIILNMLFETIEQHTKLIAADNFDIIAHIYEIVNITYIFDSIREAFVKITSCLQDYQQGGLTDSDGDRSMLLTSIDRFQNVISDCLQLYDPMKPLTIFRNEIRLLSFQLRTLRTVVNK